MLSNIAKVFMTTTTDGNKDDKDHHDGKWAVMIAHADTMEGVQVSRAFHKAHYRVMALCGDPHSKYGDMLRQDGAKVIHCDTRDPQSVREGFSFARDRPRVVPLILIPSPTSDGVLRCNNVINEAVTTCASVVLWSVVGTEHAMELPEDETDWSEGGGEGGEGGDDQPKPTTTKKNEGGGGDRRRNSLMLVQEMEELVRRAQGIETSVLRVGFPLQHFTLLRSAIQNRGQVPFLALDQHFAPVDRADAAAATVGLVSFDEGIPPRFRAPKMEAVLLVGPDRMNAHQFVDAANDGLTGGNKDGGPRLDVVEADINDMRAYLSQASDGPYELSMTMCLWRLFAEGKLDTDERAGSTLRELLEIRTPGRKPTNVADYFTRNRDNFAPRHGHELEE